MAVGVKRLSDCVVGDIVFDRNGVQIEILSKRGRQITAVISGHRIYMDESEARDVIVHE